MGIIIFFVEYELWGAFLFIIDSFWHYWYIYIGNKLEILEDNKKIIRYPIENINNNARIYSDYYVNYNKYFINYKQSYIIEKRL